MHFLSDAELLRESLQFGLQRPLARNDEFGMCKLLRYHCKSTNSRSDALFLDYPTGLHDLPAAVGGKFPRHHGAFVERDSGTIDADLFSRATEFDQAIG